MEKTLPGFSLDWILLADPVMYLRVVNAISFYGAKYISCCVVSVQFKNKLTHRSAAMRTTKPPNRLILGSRRNTTASLFVEENFILCFDRGYRGAFDLFHFNTEI